MLWFVMICYDMLWCWYVMLWYDMLWYATRCYDMLQDVMIRYVMICYVMICYNMLQYVTMIMNSMVYTYHKTCVKHENYIICVLFYYLVYRASTCYMICCTWYGSTLRTYRPYTPCATYHVTFVIYDLYQEHTEHKQHAQHIMLHMLFMICMFCMLCMLWFVLCVAIHVIYMLDVPYICFKFCICMQACVLYVWCRTDNSTLLKHSPWINFAHFLFEMNRKSYIDKSLKSSIWM